VPRIVHPVLGKLRETGDLNLGHDAQQGQYVDMNQGGYRRSRQGGAAGSPERRLGCGLLITTKVLVVEKLDRPAGSPGLPDGGDFAA
jgi:hypothetical protein